MKEHRQCYNCYGSIEDIKRCVRDGHQVLILMRGVPGSGKTYLARELLSLREDGIICSTDDYFLDKDGNYNFNFGLLDEYHKKNYNKARDAIRNCKTPVIIDNTNIRSEHMKSYISQASQNYYEIYIVEPMTAWKRKAGECARRNIHQVSKERIADMLDDMDCEQDPPLESLLGKGYTVLLTPPMDGDDYELGSNITDNLSGTSLFGTSTPLSFAAPPGLSVSNVHSVDPIFSMLHVPKPVKHIVRTREIAIQTTDVSVTLSLVGLTDIIDDVFEGEYEDRERLVEVINTKERQTQFPRYPTSDKTVNELDLLVCIYPSEDMSTLYHNYQQYGLINTIKMNCDVGLMPDHTAEVISGSFNKEIAKALETGSFDHEFIADTISDANTSTSNSEQTEDTNEQIYEVDIGKDLFKQLQTHFGSYPNDNNSTSTVAFLPESLLRKIFEAVLHQRATVAMDTSILYNDAQYARELMEKDAEYAQKQDMDAEYARRLQETEDCSILPPKTEMNGAQYLQYRQLLRDYPGYDASTLQNLYASTKYNMELTIFCLTGRDQQLNKDRGQSIKPVKNVPKVSVITKTAVARSRTASPSYFESSGNKKIQKSRYFDEAHEMVIQYINNAQEYKEKKDELLGIVYNCGSGSKSIHYINHRHKVQALAKQEREQLNKAREILFEANRNSKYLDLHYLSQRDALDLVKERLQQLDRREGDRGPIRNLTIVTGYGKTSGGREIVKKFITGWLSSKQYKYHFSNKGSIEVTCK